MHCFGAGWEQAQRSLELGFLISFAGNLTYPKAQNLRDIAARLPLESLLVETDAPWLAPCTPTAASAMSRLLAYDNGRNSRRAQKRHTGRDCRIHREKFLPLV